MYYKDIHFFITLTVIKRECSVSKIIVQRNEFESYIYSVLRFTLVE